jgi:hypothetical protein
MKPLLRLGGSRKAYAVVWPLITDLPDGATEKNRRSARRTSSALMGSSYP